MLFFAVDCGFEPWSGQTKDYEIGGVCCFSAKHARNRDNVFEWSNMSTCGLLFLHNNMDHFIECNLFLPWYS